MLTLHGKHGSCTLEPSSGWSQAYLIGHHRVGSRFSKSLNFRCSFFCDCLTNTVANPPPPFKWVFELLAFLPQHLNRYERGPNPGLCPSFLPLLCSSRSSSSPCMKSWRISAGTPSHSVSTAPRSSDRPSTLKRQKRYKLHRYDLHHPKTHLPQNDTLMHKLLNHTSSCRILL